MLLTSKERKQVFEKYVKERAEEERREKRNKMKERKEQFQKLLEEAGLHGKYAYKKIRIFFILFISAENVNLYIFCFFADHHLAILLKNMEGMNDLRM